MLSAFTTVEPAVVEAFGNATAFESWTGNLTIDLAGDLKAPVQRIGSKYAPVPFSPPLEQAFLYSEDEVTAAIKRIMG